MARQQVALFHLASLGDAQLIDLYLQAIFEARAAAAHFYDVALVEFFGDARIAWIPDARFKLAGFVAQNQVQVGFVGFGGALLLGEDKEKAVEVPALFECGQIGYIDFFHSAGKDT